jgi:hypothetical protein
MGWASIGMWASPEVENALGMVPTPQEKEDLDRKLNVKIVGVEKE